MPEPSPRISVAMSTEHPGMARVAAVLAQEGLLEDFLVPLDLTAVDRVLKRFLPAGHGLRQKARHWRHEPRGTSGAPFDEAVVAAAFRLPDRLRARLGVRALVRRRYRSMARAIVRTMKQKHPAAMLLLQHQYADAIARASPDDVAVWLFALSDEWDLAESLAIATARMPPGPLRDEAEAEMPARQLKILNSALSRASAVITESSRMAAFAARSARPGTPIVPIGQGVDTTRFRPGVERDFSARPLRVVQLSRIVHGKGLLVANETAGLAGTAVDIWNVFGWEAERSPVLSRSIPNLRVPGPLTLDRLVLELQRADVFVLPTLGDSMPRAVLEAMACGLPVITTDRSGYDGLIRDGENGFVVPVLDPDAIVVHLKRLSEDPGLRRRLGLAARITAEGYTWEAMGERFRSALYESLLPSLRRGL